MSGERGPRREGRLGLSLAGARAAGAAVVVAIGLLVVGAVCLWILWEPGPAAKSGPATDVILLPGSGLSEIAADLKGAGVIRSGALFMAAAQAGGASRSLKAGEYLIPSGASLARVLAKIRSGEVVRHMVTIPEGATSAEVAAILDGEPYLKGVAPTPPEGSVLPETYAALWGEDRARLLQRMMQARDVLLASLWEHRRAGLPYASPEEAVIIASIVEKETAKPNERPLIAAVFLNRLAKGMRLQSDPTVIYGLTGGKPLGHGLTQSELASPTPYNTYQVNGLPPTPISNPGRASLAAALDPPQTNNLYFVADGTGGHAFSATLAQHAKNVARWRSIELAKAQTSAPSASKPEARRDPP